MANDEQRFYEETNIEGYGKLVSGSFCHSQAVVILSVKGLFPLALRSRPGGVNGPHKTGICLHLPLSGQVKQR